jgi:NAD(P)-dependent dehydrogenase (short-subunit alcohol dehydrogenase family)
MTTEPSETSSYPQALPDRVAIVTGAGRGIGRGIARCLARAGAEVAVVEQAEDRIAGLPKSRVSDGADSEFPRMWHAPTT